MKVLIYERMARNTHANVFNSLKACSRLFQVGQTQAKAYSAFLNRMNSSVGTVLLVLVFMPYWWALRRGERQMM